MFKLPPEILTNHILLQLSYPELLNFCNTSRQFQQICTDNIFWKIKLDYDFTTLNLRQQRLIPSLYHIQYGLNIESWNTVYNIWYRMLNRKINESDDLIDRNVLYADIIIFRLDRGDQFGELNNELNSEYSEDDYNLDVYTMSRILKELYGLALKYNNLDVLKKLDTMGISYNDYIQGINNTIKPYIETVAMDIIEWIGPNIITYGFTTSVTTYGRIDILDWLSKYNIFPKTIDLLYAIQNNRFQLVQWAVAHGIYPDQSGINAIVYTNNFDMLDWFLEHNMIPNSCASDIAVINDNIPMLRWLIDHDIKPHANIIHKVLNRTDTTMLEFLWIHGIRPTQDDINETSTVQCLTWLEQHGMLPDARAANIALHKGEWDILEWMLKRNIYPTIRYLKDKIPPPDVVRLLDNHMSHIQDRSIHYEIFKPDNPAKVLNPITRRWIIRGGSIYNKLVKQGIIILRS